MSAPVDFYFDFSSPYTYPILGPVDILTARHDRDLRWRPILLGPVMAAGGVSPPFDSPVRAAYMLRDVGRICRRMRRPFKPGALPFSAVAAARAFYWFEARDPETAVSWAKRMFTAFYTEGRAIDTPENVVAAAAKWLQGQDMKGDEVVAALGEETVKRRLRDETDAAIARGVFGSPFFFIDDEPFWGGDRLEDMDRWLKTLGF